jgi:hypothetical protein
MAMMKIQGKIAKAGAYPLKVNKTVNFKGVDKIFTHRHTIQMESGEWIGFGESHLDNFLVKDDDDKFQVLGEGSEVLIKYELNGEFRNAKKTNLVVLELVVGTKFQAPQSQQASQGQAQQPQSAPASKVAFVNPAEVGQCLNLAVEVMKLNAEDLLNDAKVTEAITWYKAVREKFNALYNLPPAKPKEKPVAKPAPAPTDVDNFDDDI